MLEKTNLNSTLQLRIGVFLQDGVVNGRLGQLVFVCDAFRLLDDDGCHLAQTVAAQTVAPSRSARDDIKINLRVRKRAIGEARLPGLCHAVTVLAAQRVQNQRRGGERVE
jgi:hypothetical protein